MKRREFIGLVGGAATWPLAARAQQIMPVVGILYSTTIDDFQNDLAGLRSGLAELGFIEGQNVVLQFNAADGHFDRLPMLATDLVRRRVAVIITGSNAAPALVAKTATQSIPIVFVMGADPVGIGLVASLARPVENITGITTLAGELFGKRLALLQELLPQVKTIGYLINMSNPAFSEVAVKKEGGVADSLGFKILILNASNPTEITRAFETLLEQGAGALLVGPDSFFNAQREQIITLAAHHAMPASYSRREYVAAGGLFSYGSDPFDAYRSAGIYAGRILKGEDPKNLPIQQPTSFKFALNLKTARALGFTIPPTLLARADEVIE